MGRFSVFILLGFASCLAISCSKPAALPSLQQPKSPVPVALSQKLSTEDIRTIFKTLNHDGRFSAFAPYLESEKVPVEQLSPWLSKHLFETAEDSDGFLSVLEELIDERQFSAALEQWNNWTDSYPHLSSSLPSLMAEPPFFDALAGMSQWLQPESLETYQAFLSGYRQWRAPAGPSLPALTPSQLSMDIRSLSNGEGPWNSYWAKINGSSLGQAILEAISESELPTRNGFVTGLGSMANTSMPDDDHQLMGLLQWLHLTNQPTNGFFSKVAAQIANQRSAVRQISSLMHPRLTRAVATVALRKMGSELTPSRWKQLGEGSQEVWTWAFSKFFQAIDEVKQTSQTGTDEVLRNLSVYLNAYVLATWLEETASLNPLGDFRGESLLSLPIQQLPQSLELASLGEEQRWTLSPKLAERFSAIGLESFTEALEQLVQREGFGEFYIEFSQPLQAMTMRQAVHQAVRDADAYRPMGDLTPAVSLLFDELENPSSAISLHRWDSQNLLTLINEKLAAFEIHTLTDLGSILFQDWGFADLSSDLRGILEGFLPEEAGEREKGLALLDLLPAVESIQNTDRFQHPPLALYHGVLRQLPIRQYDDIGHTVNWVKQSQLLDKDHFPAFHAFLRNGTSGARTLNGFAALETNERLTAKQRLGELLAQWTSLTHCLKKLNQRSQQGTEELAAFMLSGSWNQWELPQSLTQWIATLGPSPEFEKLWQFFSHNSSWSQTAAVLNNLTQLEQNGYLLEASRRLHHFEDPRLKRLSRVLVYWIETGEFAKWLKLSKKFVPPGNS